MALSDGFLLKVKRAETPFYRFLKRLAQKLPRARLPVPRWLKPFFRFLYELHFLLVLVLRWLRNGLYCQPLFRSRCAHVGRNFHMELMPFVSGHAGIYIGDDVVFTGRVAIMSGRVFDCPRLVLHDRVTLGHNVTISVNREVVIEEDVRIASHCYIADNDGHSTDAELRARNLPPRPQEVRPVRIGRKAWVGTGCYVMKGVTIGEGAILGTNSVAISDIPPYCLALGNPAEVILRNVGKPRRTAPGPAATGDPSAPG